MVLNGMGIGLENLSSFSSYNERNPECCRGRARKGARPRHSGRGSTLASLRAKRAKPQRRSLLYRTILQIVVDERRASSSQVPKINGSHEVLEVAIIQEYRPMLAFPTPEPSLGKQFDWEIKWDGYRCGLVVRDGVVRLLSRQGKNFTQWFPELQILASQMAGSEVLVDGEVIADDGSIASFNVLQRHARTRGNRSVHGAHISFVAFDLLWHDGQDWTVRPLRERRLQLETISQQNDRLSVSRVYSDGRALLAAASAHGLEGVVGKDRESFYQLGRRSRTWLKTKIPGSWKGHNWS